MGLNFLKLHSAHTQYTQTDDRIKIPAFVLPFDLRGLETSILSQNDISSTNLYFGVRAISRMICVTE